MRMQHIIGGSLLSAAVLLCLPTAVHATQVASGTYSGDGTDNRSITGVGFTPDVVVIQADGVPNGVFRTATMSGDESAPYGSSNYVTDAIQALEADGFQVGGSNRVNQNGTAYYWVALQATSTEGAVLRYIGNGTDNRSITGVGFAPEFALIKGDVGGKAFFRTHDMPSDFSLRLSGDEGSNLIQALAADSFEIGADEAVNTNNKTYDAVLWSVTSGSFAVGTYTGDGTDNRSITGVGFAPDVVVVKHQANKSGVFRTTAHSGSHSSVFDDATIADGIQALEADGFQVGTDQKVNHTGKVFYWMAWKHVAPDTTAPDIPQATPTGGSYTSTQTVTLSAESNASIYYTLDGSTPTLSSPLYSSALTIAATTTVRTLAVDAAGNQSTVLAATYTITPPATSDSSSTSGTESEAESTPLIAAAPLPKKAVALPAASNPPLLVEPLTETQPTVEFTTTLVSPELPVETPTALPSPTAVSPPVTAPPVPTTRHSPGRVAGIFFRSLVHTSLAAENIPLHMQPYTRVIQTIDTLLVGAAALLFVTVAGVAGYTMNVSLQYAPVRQTLRFAFRKPYGDPALHFSKYAPRAAGRSGEILVPFSLWKILVRAEQWCLATFAGIAAGKILIATLIVILIVLVRD